MMRAALHNPQWSQPEQLWLSFLIAVLLHTVLLGMNGIIRSHQNTVPTFPMASVVDQATPKVLLDAPAAVVNRAASGNNLTGDDVAVGVAAESRAKAAEAFLAGPVVGAEALAGSEGAAMLLQRSAPIKVYYSRSQERFVGDAASTLLSASAAAGDSGQSHHTAVAGPSHLLSIGPASKEHMALQYVEGWRRWMKANGNQFYPTEARRLGLRGDVLTQVRLNRDGSLADVRILRSSGERLLDQAVIQTTREARWYLPFPPELAQRYQQLEFSWRWRYGAAQ